MRAGGYSNVETHKLRRTAWFTYLITVSISRPRNTVRCLLIVEQPYEAIQARARKDHITFSFYFNDFNTTGASSAAVQQDVAIVFLLSDSGEGYITVDGNVGDRHVSPPPLQRQDR